MNICEHLTATARILPEQTAVVFEGQSLTYAHLNSLSIAAADELRAVGIRPGDRVAIMLPNVPSFIVWYYGALRIGAIVVSISTRSAPAEVAFVAKDCSARVIVCDEPTLQKVNDELPIEVEAKIVTDALATTLMRHGRNQMQADARKCDVVAPKRSSQDGGEFSQATLTNAPANPPQNSAEIHNAKPDDPALILYTSGTTGFPKGATLSHMNVRSNVNAFNHLCNMQSEDRMLLAVPLFHCFGQNALLNSAFNVGATLILQHRFDLKDTQRLINDHKVTQIYGVPMMFQLLLESCGPDDFPAVSYCFSAAAPLPLTIGQQWQAKFHMPIHEGYGLTETSPFASYNHRIRFQPGSIGTPVDCVEMKIIDPESGDECPVGKLGEIAIKGPNVMLGYWNRPEETSAAIKDGWFQSGDIGRVDEDGFYYIVDRVKDMIAVGGLKIFPAEVERVILDHDSVRDVAVVGMPDDVFGEQVVGFVVLGDMPDGVSDVLADIVQHTKQHLASYKVPRQIVRLDELPRNPSGKVLKTQLRCHDLADFRDQASSAQDHRVNDGTAEAGGELRRQLENAHPATRTRLATEYVQNMIRDVADTAEPLDADTQLLDAGLDSLMVVEMSHRIQREFGESVPVPATLVFDHPRICDLAEYLVSTLINNSNVPETAARQTKPDMELRQQIASMSEDQALEELLKELET